MIKNNTKNSAEIVFIQTDIEDFEFLLSEIDPSKELIRLDAAKDGLAQMAEFLTGRSDIAAIHLISHGSIGSIQLGSLALSEKNLQNHVAHLTIIGNSLADNADIFLYACNVSAGSVGSEFISALGVLTNADIAASNNLTGAYSKGGDWVLENVTGQIDENSLILSGYQGVLLRAKPVIINLDSDSVDWVDKITAVVLDTQTDSAADHELLGSANSGYGDWANASLNVARATGALASDILGFGEVGYTVSGSNLQSGGLTFATFTNANGSLTINFTSSGTIATTALVNAVLRNITYLNATPTGDTTVSFSLSDGISSFIADVTVSSNTIYITNATDTATIDVSDGISFSEAVGIAAADVTGTQTLVLNAGLNDINLVGNLTVSENLILNQSGSSRLLAQNTLTIESTKTLTLTGAGLYLLSGLAGDGNLTINIEGAQNVLLTGNNSGLTNNSTVTLVTGGLEMEAATALGSGTIIAKAAIGQGRITGNINANTINNDIQFFDSGSYLNLSGTALTLSGEVDLNNATGHIYNNNGASATFSGVISNGNLSVERGIVIISGSNTFDKIYIKGDLYSEVTTQIADDSNLGTGAIYLSSSNLASSATNVLEITGSSVTIDNDIVMNAYNGGGTIKNDNNVTLSGQISEVVDAWPYKLYKTGVGTLTFSGTSNYNTGALNVEAGIVNITGALNNAATATIASGAAFGGSGAFGGETTVNSGGKLGIDGAVNVFTIDDNLVLSSGATYSVEINGTTAGTQHDQTMVNGTVNLTGATLSVSGSHTPVTGNSIVLIANDGSDAVSGTFTGLAEGATVMLNDVAMTISYVGGTGNDVVLSKQNVLVTRSLSYSASTFDEAADNNGSIITTSIITLSNDTFTGVVGDALGVVSRVPDGLTAVLVKASDTTALLSFTGNATAHANAQDITNLAVNFADADFTLGSAATVTNAYKPDLTVNFADPKLSPKPAPKPKPTPTPESATIPVVTLIDHDGVIKAIYAAPGANTSIPEPATGTTIVASSSGNTLVTNPGSAVILNNAGTGIITTSGITVDSTLTIIGTGMQQVDIAGMKPGQMLTIDNSGTGMVALKNLPDGVILKLLGTGQVIMSDSDNVTSSIENAAPALFGGQVGDSNGDGIPDAMQSNVASAFFLQTDSAQSNPGNSPPVFVSLVADAKGGKIDTTNTITAALFNVHQLDAPINLPAEIKMPMGFIAFSAALGLTTPITSEQSGTPALGASASFSLYVDPAVEVNGYWKQDATKTWVNLASPAFGGQTVIEGGKTRLDFKITDGGEFDADGKVDGTITDPGAAASMPLSLVGYAPTLADGTQFWF